MQKIASGVLREVDAMVNGDEDRYGFESSTLTSRK